MTQLIGAAFGSDPDPVKHAQKIGAQCFQIQAGDPQGWKKPALDFPGGAKELAAQAKELKMDINKPLTPQQLAAFTQHWRHGKGSGNQPEAWYSAAVNNYYNN